MTAETENFDGCNLLLGAPLNKLCLVIGLTQPSFNLVTPSHRGPRTGVAGFMLNSPPAGHPRFYSVLIDVLFAITLLLKEQAQQAHRHY